MSKQGGLNRRQAAAVLGASAAVLAAGRASGATRPVAHTRYGSVRGGDDAGIKVFKGIRYGADTAPRRFQAPLAPEHWSGVREATAFGPASPQQRGEAHQSEDCLFLNVWTPGLRDNRRRAVMVYVHGGAYSGGSGSSPLYDGVKLCQRGDVVVVTLNHRLNAFGYCSLARIGGADFADSGNAGQLDLVLALKWVRDNIAEFGGDPGRIMVFGQSGGGAKIATLMAMPAATGLFHRGATMSGQQVTASGPLNAQKRTEAYMRQLGIAADHVADMRTAPMQHLIEAQSVTDPVLGFGGVYFGPVLDFKNLMRHPFYPDAAPQGLTIPMVQGNVHDETRGFIGTDRSMFSYSWEQVIEHLPSQMRIDTDPAYVVAAYREHFPQMSPSDVYFAASTAARSWRGQVIEAEERAKAGAPAYVYQVNFRSPREGGIFGAPHTMDIGLSFGNLGAEGSFTGTGADAEAVSHQLQQAFIALAKTGDPNCDAIPHWAPYTLPTRETMIVDTQFAMENNPRQWEREFFAKIPYIQPGT